MQSPFDEQGSLNLMDELDSEQHRWPGAPTVISYSFLSAVPSYYGTINPGDKYSDFQEFDADQVAAFKALFNYIETIIPVKFNDTTDGENSGENRVRVDFRVAGGSGLRLVCAFNLNASAFLERR